MSNELGKNEVLVQFNGVGGELLQFHAAEVTVYSDARPRYPRTDIIWVRIKALFGGTYKIAATSIQPLFNGSHDRSIANVIKFTEGWNVPFKVADLHVYGINLPVFPHPKKETLTVDVKMDENMKETVEGLKELLRLIDKNLLDHGARINEMKTVLDHMGVGRSGLPRRRRARPVPRHGEERGRAAAPAARVVAARRSHHRRLRSQRWSVAGCAAAQRAEQAPTRRGVGIGAALRASEQGSLVSAPSISERGKFFIRFDEGRRKWVMSAFDGSVVYIDTSLKSMASFADSRLAMLALDGYASDLTVYRRDGEISDHYSIESRKLSRRK